MANIKISITKVKGSGYAIIAKGNGLHRESKYYPDRGDAVKVARKIARRLKAQGHNVRIG